MGTRFKCNEETIARTKAGKIRGFYDDGIYTFHGIRYARAKRFQMPEPVKPWEGVKDALSYGYICPVLNQPRPTGEVTTPHRFWPENENCQYLNIWTGTLDPRAKKPVLVWLHGGGFFSGSSIEQVCYDGAALADFGDVVVVSVNHRLNVFGYLDLSSFGEPYKNSGNAGMADLVAALKWVHENIEAFGGNPENVTIFGQSGGGAKVTALGQIPEADGLFHKAVIMSGVFSSISSGEEVKGRELVLEILHQAGLKEDDVDRLAGIPSQRLIEAVNAAEKKFSGEGKYVEWNPVPNDWYVGDPLDCGFRDHFKAIPTLVGSVLGEFDLQPPILHKDQLSLKERRDIVAEKYGDEYADEVIRRFKAAYPDKNEVYVRSVDLLFRPGTLEYVRKKSEKGAAPVYCYMFSVCFDIDGDKLAWHCSDIPFWFHNTSLIPVCRIDGVTEKLEKVMSMALVNFARSGNPNAAGLPGWDPCTPDHVVTMILDRICEVKIDHEKDLIPYLEKVTPPFHFDPSVMGSDDDDDSEGSAWFY